MSPVALILVEQDLVQQKQNSESDIDDDHTKLAQVLGNILDYLSCGIKLSWVYLTKKNRVKMQPLTVLGVTDPLKFTLCCQI